MTNGSVRADPIGEKGWGRVVKRGDKWGETVQNQRFRGFCSVLIKRYIHKYTKTRINRSILCRFTEPFLGRDNRVFNTIDFSQTNAVRFRLVSS